MSCRKVLLSAVAVLAPLGLVAVAVGPASAGVKPLRHQKLPLRATGSVQCALSGDMAFNPPLTSVGTRPNTLLLHEHVTLNLTPSSCLPSDPTQAPTAPAVTVKPMLQKDEVIMPTTNGKPEKVLGDCAMGFNPMLKNHESWTWGTYQSGGFTEPWDGSRVHFPSMSEFSTAQGENGFSGTGSSAGSYAGHGSVTLTLVADPASWAALQAVCQPGSGLGSVSELDLSGTASSISMGSSK
jgi:hypothetical protein